MGYNIDWVAVKTDSPEAVWNQIGVTGTGRYSPRPALSGAMLPSGWYLIIYDHRAIRDPRDPHYRQRLDPNRLSEESEVVRCEILESIMFHSVEAWDKGKEKWHVTHDSEEGMFDLTVTGDPPDILEAIKKKHIDEQVSEGGENAGVDLICEIPLDLAREIVGYKHDEYLPELKQVHFEELVDPETLRRRLHRGRGPISRLWAFIRRVGYYQ